MNGKRVAFSRDELAKMVFLLEAKAMGEKLHKRTSFDEAKCNVERASSRAHVFWSDPCHGNWSLPASLPPFTQISLWSMHRAGMDVTLWTYHTSVVGVPPSDRIEVKNAGALISRAAAELAMDNGWSIHHIADFIRLRAVHDHPGGAAPQQEKEVESDVVVHIPVKRGAWFIDVDFIFVQGFGILPSKSGHVFALLDAKTQSRGKSFLPEFRHNFVRSPDEAVWFSSPWYFPEGSECLRASLDGMQAKFAEACGAGKPLRLRYRWIMELVLDEARCRGLQLDMVDPALFNPIKYFEPQKLLCSQFEGNLSETCIGFNTWTHKSGPAGQAPKPPILSDRCFLWETMQLLGLSPHGDSLSTTFFCDVHRCAESAGKRHRMSKKSSPIVAISGRALAFDLVVSPKPWPPGVASWLTVDDWLSAVVSSKGIARGHMDEVKAVWVVERETISRSQHAARKLGLPMMTGLALASSALRVWRLSRNYIKHSPQCPAYLADLHIAVGAALSGEVGDPDAVAKHAKGDRTSRLWKRDVLALSSKCSLFRMYAT